MNYRKLIENICREEKIDFDLLSKNWVMALSKNNITHLISGYRFPLNDHALGSVIDDKYAFYDLCKLKKLPIIEHHILFNPNSKLGENSFSLLKEYFYQYNENVVLKPNLGTEGTDVFHITNYNDLLDVTTKLFENNFSISICPFYKIDNEYRVIVLNNEIKLIYEKNKPIVIGDGIHTIKELLIKLNPYYFNNFVFKEEYNKVLNKKEIFEYDWRFNLSKGATAKLVENNELYKILSNFALNVCKKINAKFISVDIIKCNNNFYLMEANSGVCINKVTNFIDKDLKTTKEIYREVILNMFK